MSFILDAIAKSEQERQQQEVPQAQILALPLGNTQRPRRLLPYLVAAALILNAVVVVIWMQSNNSDPGSLVLDKSDIVEGQEVQTTTVAPVAAVEQTVAEEEQIIAPTPEPLTNATNDSANIKDDTTWIRAEPETLSNQLRSEPEATKSAAENSEIKMRSVSRPGELPGNIRKDLPTVVFSGHLYSTNPNSSIVFVDNNRPVKMGQRIVDEVYLHEITATGVVVEFRGYLIDVGVLQNWTLN